MKKFLVFSILLSVLSSPSLSSISFAAEEENRPANPGDDPNEVNPNNGAKTQASVAAHGTGCSECLSRVVENRLQDNTTSKQGSSNSTGGKSGGYEAAQ